MKAKKTKFRMHLIKKAMKDQGLNQDALAKKINCSKQLLSYYLQHPSLHSVWQIAYVLKLNLKDIIK